MLLVCKDDAEPAGRGAGEGLTTAQHHLVSEERPPQRQLLLKRRLFEVLPKRRGRCDTSSLRECTHCVFSINNHVELFSLELALYNWNIIPHILVWLWSWYLSEVSPDIQCSGPVQVGHAHILQLSCQVTVSSFQSAPVLRQKFLTDPL